MRNLDDERIRAAYAESLDATRAPERLKAAVLEQARACRATADADAQAAAERRPSSDVATAPGYGEAGTQDGTLAPDQAFPAPRAFSMRRNAASDTADRSAAAPRAFSMRHDRETETASCGAPTPRSMHSRIRPQRERLALRIAAAACAAAVVIGVATVGVLGAPLLAGNAADPAVSDGPGVRDDAASKRIVNTVQNPNPGANFFTLVAFADEAGASGTVAGTEAGAATIAAVPVEPGEKFALDAAAFDGGSALSDGEFFDPETGTWVRDGSIAGVKMGLGPVLTGENIETISIEVEGDDAWLERFSYDLGEHGMYTYQKRVDLDGEAFLLNNAQLAWNGGDRSNSEIGNMSDDEKRATFQNGYVSIYLGVEAGDEARAAGEARKAVAHGKTNADGLPEWDEFTDEEYDEYERWAVREGALMALDTANKLATCTFTATATFSDGTTQTKRFVIEPVEGFYDAYFAYSTAMREFIDEQNELYKQGRNDAALAVEEPESPTLYTITELVEQ